MGTKEELILLAEVQYLLSSNISGETIHTNQIQELRNKADKLEHEEDIKKRFKEYVESKEKEFIDTSLDKQD